MWSKGTQKLPSFRSVQGESSQFIPGFTTFCHKLFLCSSPSSLSSPSTSSLARMVSIQCCIIMSLFLHSENMPQQFSSPLLNFIIDALNSWLLCNLHVYYSLFSSNSKDSFKSCPSHNPPPIHPLTHEKTFTLCVCFSCFRSKGESVLHFNSFLPYVVCPNSFRSLHCLCRSLHSYFP